MSAGCPGWTPTETPSAPCAASPRPRRAAYRTPSLFGPGGARRSASPRTPPTAASACAELERLKMPRRRACAPPGWPGAAAARGASGLLVGSLACSAPAVAVPLDPAYPERNGGLIQCSTTPTALLVLVDASTRRAGSPRRAGHAWRAGGGRRRSGDRPGALPASEVGAEHLATSSTRIHRTPCWRRHRARQCPCLPALDGRPAPRRRRVERSWRRPRCRPVDLHEPFALAEGGTPHPVENPFSLDILHPRRDDQPAQRCTSIRALGVRRALSHRPRRTRRRHR